MNIILGPTKKSAISSGNIHTLFSSIASKYHDRYLSSTYVLVMKGNGGGGRERKNKIKISTVIHTN